MGEGEFHTDVACQLFNNVRDIQRHLLLEINWDSLPVYT